MSKKSDRRLYKEYLPKLYPQKRGYDKVGRNEVCPCGSGKKWKKCCLNGKE